MINFIIKYFYFLLNKRKAKKQKPGINNFASCMITLPPIHLDSCDIKEIQKESLKKYNKIQESKETL
jgi:hypothetical protein